jgi:hypothetical protein
MNAFYYTPHGFAPEPTQPSPPPSYRTDTRSTVASSTHSDSSNSDDEDTSGVRFDPTPTRSSPGYHDAEHQNAYVPIRAPSATYSTTMSQRGHPMRHGDHLTPQISTTPAPLGRPQQYQRQRTVSAMSGSPSSTISTWRTCAS